MNSYNTQDTAHYKKKILELLGHTVYHYLLSLAPSELRAIAKIRSSTTAVAEYDRSRQFTYILLLAEVPRTLSSGK